MSHSITIVDDDQLPEGHDFVYVDFPAGAHIFYRRSTLAEGPLEDSWAAYRALMRRKPPSSPTRAGIEGRLLNFAQRPAMVAVTLVCALLATRA